jgi:glutamate--cysteine ligase
MTEGHRQLLTRELLLGYFLEAFTARTDWRIGMELETMGVDAATGTRIPYDGRRASVRSCLERYLDARGGDPAYEGENLIGIDGSWGALTLEPGGQVEWSSRPQADLALLADGLDAHLRELDAVARALGIRWLDEAMDPETALEDVPWMPKARYKILRPYLGARGRLAHRMMTQTTSIQCAFDFEDHADWSRKFRGAALLSPVAVALFANSSRADGRETGYRSYREAIWRETDPERCGLPPVVFDPGFGIEAWLEWVLDTPAIFLHRVRGLVPAGGVPFRALMRRTGCKAIGMEDWELHLSAIFTEVRSYSYIEIRSADMQPAGKITAVPALYTGLLYDSGNLGQVLELCAGHDRHEAWREAMDSAARSGLDGTAGGRPIRELAERIVALALEGLERNPEHAGDPERAGRVLLDLAEDHGLDPGAAAGSGR